MSFRKEKKFRLTLYDFNKLQSSLIEKGMETMYEPRKINSLYFDTLSLQSFSDSEEGTLPRKKIRVRWYNDYEKLTIEKKISSVEGRYKTTKQFKKNLSPEHLLFERFFDDHYGITYPILIVSYIRYYFQFNSMRVTFDKNITYQYLQSISKRIYKDPERVMEIKIPINCTDDYIERYIPYQTSRFSKYSRGILFSTGKLNEF
tara:strand:+ start:627 stop:1235 length:609 start_codon:yes stop_codon:yes gene_type:complete